MREHAWSRPQGPGGPARAYRYRLALRRPYATASAATGAVGACVRVGPVVVAL